jgi:uncharacterized protein YxeA
MKKVAIVMALVIMVVFAAGFTVMAQQAPKTAEVVKMDTKAGTITVKHNNKERTFTAEAKMLEGIKVGDTVEIQKEGKVVKSIKKVEARTMPTTPPVH